MHEGENPPVGLILCAQKDNAVAHYSLEGLPNKVMASEYLLALPDEKLLIEQIEQTQRSLAGGGVGAMVLSASGVGHAPPIAKSTAKATKPVKASRKRTERKN
jgi:hypothetical protein